MVKVFKPGKASSKSQPREVELTIDAVDHQGRGIARSQPVTFVEGALPGEKCLAKISKSQKQVRFASAEKILSPSEYRQTPPCEYFQQCGGCQTQYCQPDKMLAVKQQAMTSLIEKLTELPSAQIPWLPAITGNDLRYRRKARLALDCRDKHHLKLGFRGKDGKTIVDINHCAILRPELDQLLAPLKTLLQSMSARRHLGHISLFSGDNGVQVTMRITGDLPEADRQRLQEFQQQQGCTLLLENNEHQFHSVAQDSAEACYSLQVGQRNLTLRLQPNDFVQVNADVNQRMVQQALDWLAPNTQDNCLDLFCGIGNFTLPLACTGTNVTGFEVSAEMVQQARENARLNGIESVSYVCGDLSDAQTLQKLARLNFNKVLLDPARAGAYEAIQQIIKHQPDAILYVSCNPATFGRDIALLLQHRYRMAKISLLDMFPYTSHTEVMALFVQDTH
ncbi:MAG: 23S rRNA (uracil(1939)-C(5))-methyltransferase RlmD [Aestuariibacter sp.]